MTATLVGPTETDRAAFPGEPFHPTTRTWSRRSVLGALSALAVGTVTGCSVSGTDSEDFGGAGGQGGSGGSGRNGAPRLQYQPRKPYNLQAECELTEDFFMVQTLPIDYRHDTVVAYSRADGDVEAIVLQSGVIHQYYRDATQVGGWGSYAVSDATTPDVEAVVAGMSSVDAGGAQGTGSWLKVFYTRKSDPNGPRTPFLYIATETDAPRPGSGPRFEKTVQVDWSAKTVDLQLTLDVDDSLLVSGMQPSSYGQLGALNPDARLYFWTDARTADVSDGSAVRPTDGYLSGFSYANPNQGVLNVFERRSPWSAVVAKPYQGNADAGSGRPTLMLYLPANSYADDDKYAPTLRIWARAILSGSAQSLSAVDWSQVVDTPGPLDGIHIDHTLVSVEHVTTQGGTNTPTVLVQTLTLPGGPSPSSRRLFVGSHDCHAVDGGGFGAWSWTELGSPVTQRQGAYFESFSSGLRPLDPQTEASEPGKPAPRSYFDVFQLINGVLSVFRQAPTGSAYRDYSDPSYCAAIPLETGVSLMAGQAGQSTGDELLYIGTDGRLRILVKDPAAGWSTSVCQLPAEELQQVPTYRVLLSVADSAGTSLVGTTLKMTASTAAAAMVDHADGTSVSVSLGAVPLELTTDDAGQISLAVIAEGASAPTLSVTTEDGTGFTVFPSQAVNTYFQGGIQLNYLNPVDDPGTLTNAVTSTDTPLFPQAKDSGQEADAVATMTGAATQATANGLTAAAQSSVLERRDGALTESARGRKAAVGGIGKDIDKWGHDGLHAIKKGAAKVTAVAHEVEKGVFQLVADFEGWAGQVITIVVKGIEDAAHVLHAVFNKLGGPVAQAINWLMAEVIGTLVDSFKLAAQYETGVTTMAHQLATQVGRGKGKVDSWLDAEKRKIVDDFASWRGLIDPGSTMQDLTKIAVRSPVQGTRRRPRAAAASDGSSRHHGLWLYNFSRWKFDASYSDKVREAITQKEINDFIKALKSAVEKSVEDLGDVVAGFVKFLVDTIKHPNDVIVLTEEALLGAVADLVDWMFYVAKATVDLFLELAEKVLNVLPELAFEAPLMALPGLKQLLRLAKLEEPSLGRFICAVLAFPGVVAYKIAHKGKGYPVVPTSSDGARAGLVGDAESDMRWCAFGASFVWAGMESVSDVFVAFNPKKEPPRLFAIFDIVAPLVIGGLTVPYNDDVKPFGAPSFDDKHVCGTVAWALSFMDSFMAGMDFYVSHFSKDPPEVKAGVINTGLWYEALAGVWSLVLGCVQTKRDNHDKGIEYALTVLDSLPLLGAPLLVDQFLEASDGATALVEFAIDAGSGLIGGLLYAVENDPPNAARPGRR